MKRKITIIFLVVLLMLSSVGMNVIAVHAEGITEDEFWDIYDAVGDLTHSGIPLTQERIDNVRALVDDMPDGTDFYGITKQHLLKT